MNIKDRTNIKNYVLTMLGSSSEVKATITDEQIECCIKAAILDVESFLLEGDVPLDKYLHLIEQKALARAMNVLANIAYNKNDRISFKKFRQMAKEERVDWMSYLDLLMTMMDCSCNEPVDPPDPADWWKNN